MDYISIMNNISYFEAEEKTANDLSATVWITVLVAILFLICVALIYYVFRTFENSNSKKWKWSVLLVALLLIGGLVATSVVILDAGIFHWFYQEKDALERIKTQWLL